MPWCPCRSICPTRTRWLCSRRRGRTDATTTVEPRHWVTSPERTRSVSLSTTSPCPYRPAVSATMIGGPRPYPADLGRQRLDSRFPRPRVTGRSATGRFPEVVARPAAALPGRHRSIGAESRHDTAWSRQVDRGAAPDLSIPFPGRARQGGRPTRSTLRIFIAHSPFWLSRQRTATVDATFLQRAARPDSCRSWTIITSRVSRSIGQQSARLHAESAVEQRRGDLVHDSRVG